jgi:hypothetical protein
MNVLVYSGTFLFGTYIYTYADGFVMKEMDPQQNLSATASTLFAACSHLLTP